MADTSTAQTILNQVTSLLSSSATPITAIGNAVSDVAKDVNLVQNPTLVQRINQLTEGAQKDVTNVKNLLVDHAPFASVNAAFDGMPANIGIVLSESELRALDALKFEFSGKSVLGFYAAAREAKLADDIKDLVLAYGVDGKG